MWKYALRFVILCATEQDAIWLRGELLSTYETIVGASFRGRRLFGTIGFMEKEQYWGYKNYIEQLVDQYPGATIDCTFNVANWRYQPIEED